MLGKILIWLIWKKKKKQFSVFPDVLQFLSYWEDSRRIYDSLSAAVNVQKGVFNL